MVRLNRRGIREFVNQLCEDFGVKECPGVEIMSTADMADECGWFSSGCYKYDENVILLDKNAVLIDAELVLHEFYHHLQLERMSPVRFVEILEEEIGRPHCERSIEAGAKGFARAYVDFYAKKWNRLAYRD